MRKLLIPLIAASALAVAPAAASANPVLETACKVQKALGYDNVQECTLS
jgi:hypothetical protein